MVDGGIEGSDGAVLEEVCDGWLSVAGVCDGEPGVRAGAVVSAPCDSRDGLLNYGCNPRLCSAFTLSA